MDSLYAIGTKSAKGPAGAADAAGAAGKCSAEAAPAAAPARLDLGEIRQRLEAKKGPEFWRSLDELAETPEFEELVHREFPRFAAEWPAGMSRRGFLQLASASLALAGLTGCTKQPLEHIIPYVRQPEQLIPGKPLYFATALTHAGYATGVLAESHQGRPTKIEGNPDHPASLGSTDAYAQAAVLTLYDPERSQAILHNGRPGTWSAFASQTGETLRSLGDGKGLRLLSGTVTSPTLADQIQQLLKAHPQARWHRWEPAGAHQTRAAAVRAFGRPLDTRYDFTKAKVILTLGADVLCEGSSGVRYARDFAEGRRVRAHHDAMTRVYAVESVPVGMSTVADHRLQLPPAQVEAFVLALAGAVGAGGAATPIADANVQKWVQEIAKDLSANRGASLVVADEYLSPAAQVLVHGINQALGNAGATVFYQEPVEVDPVDHVQSLAELVRDMAAGQVQMLLMLDGVNPLHTAPADLPFKDALEKVALRIHHGLYQDETSDHCQWHIPAAHELEAWGDARAFDGTVSIQQPLIEPLYGGKPAVELLATMVNPSDATSYDIVRQYWTSRLPGLTAGLSELAKDTAGGGSMTTLLGMGGAFDGAPGIPGGPHAAPGAGTAGAAAAPASSVGMATPPTAAGRLPISPAPTASTATAPPVTATTVAPGASAAFEKAWRETLHAGLIPATAATRATAALNGGAVQQAAAEIQAATAASKPGEITLLLRPDPTIHDGRYASNVWLQELPKPVTKLVWENALILGPRTAERLKLTFHDTIELTVGGRKIAATTWILPGVAPDTAILSLGYGRKREGKAQGLGFDAYPLRTSTALWTAPGLGIRALGGQHIVACTQNHHAMRGFIVHEDEVAAQEEEARHVVRTGTLAEFQANPLFIKNDREAPPKDETMYPPDHPYKGHAWGMSIDLNVCTGCSACIIACQAENNIPSVGKEQVLARREMHWLRVDRYFAGDFDNPTIHNQPLPCMQCENAPCELVCPVAATTHSDEGLNDMVYNRCVGTRYCSNNCPYKVRRFNFLRYSDKDTPVLELVNNPDVTVRMRGVMEKCTYCVQRIEQAKIQAKVDRQEIPPNWIQTACQQACPTQAIAFGDIHNPQSEVAKWKADPLDYGLLEDLNTRPRTTYLAKLRNPNPALEPQELSMATLEKSRLEDRIVEAPIVAPGHTPGTVTDRITGPIFGKTPAWWLLGFAAAFGLLMVLLTSVTWLFIKGVGVWGVNWPIGWGFAIINFVWWIGIGHAGTLISAILLLFRQEWRTSINRFAEAMTLFAVACAGLFPVLHLGRPWLFYWLLPYPNTMNLWPQFRSPLIWDVFAVSTYATVSAVFWYVGLIPDLATMRDRAKNKVAAILYGMGSLGWRGSARHWHNYETAYLLLAGLSTPLVLSVHTVVSFDFSIGIVPGWHATIFPPYFVAGAIYAGFAMVLLLAIPLRVGYKLQDFVTNRHLENMGKVMLATGMIVFYGYIMELFFAWYSGNTYERFMAWNRVTGPYHYYWYALIFCNGLTPQLLWFKKLRTSPLWLFLISLVVSVGMWLERFVIVVTSLTRDFLPGSWGVYKGTIWDWGTFIGTLGLFSTLFFLFIRILPAISIFEMRTLVPGGEAGDEITEVV